MVEGLKTHASEAEVLQLRAPGFLTLENAQNMQLYRTTVCASPSSAWLQRADVQVYMRRASTRLPFGFLRQGRLLVESVCINLEPTSRRGWVELHRYSLHEGAS